MKISIITLLSLLSFPALFSHVLAQSSSGKSVYSTGQTILQGDPLAINKYKPAKEIFLVSNANAFQNRFLSTPSVQSNALYKNAFNIRGYSIYSEIMPKKEYSQMLQPSYQQELNVNSSFPKSESSDKNRRLIYSSIWAFASLNYLYCDLVGFMDAKIHKQYHSGKVDRVKMTPNFLATAAVVMQIPLSNIFLPHVIEDERTLRWVQIASGAIMTLVQSASLFAGKPTSYYAVFSGFEIAATTYITIDAIRWKPKSKYSE